MALVLAGLLYGVEVYDPGILLTASLLMLGIAILASWFPARGALRIDPVHVLRPG